jgi:hypothetical protein
MRFFASRLAVIAVFILLFLIFPYRVYAYLDLGSGSYIFQVLIIFLLGGLFTVKLYWDKVKASFKNLFARRKKSEKSDD